METMANRDNVDPCERRTRDGLAVVDGPVDRSVLRRYGLGPIDGLAVVLAGLFPVAWIPRFLVPTTPRMALMLCLGLLGLVALGRSALRRDVAALALVAVLCSAVVSALLSPGPVMSLKGDITGWMSVAFYALAAGWWAIGREVGDGARRAVPILLTVGLALNAIIGVAQVGLGINGGVLASFAGRASGLMLNPVYYASFAAGVSAYWTMRAAERARWTSVGISGATAFATGISGSRVAIAVVLAFAVFVVALRRAWSATYALGATVAGLTAAAVFTSLASEQGTIDRFGGGESVRGRAGIWRYGLDAFLDRPVFGWGLNHFGTATRPRLTADYVARYGHNDVRQPWIDPHNIGVMLLVSLGVVGVVFVGAFVVAACCGKVRAPLLAAAVATGLTWSLQPATVHSLPVAMLLLGLAVRPTPTSENDASKVADPANLSRQAIGVLEGAALAVGAALGTYLLMTTFLLSSAGRSGDLDAVVARAAWLPLDPFVEDYVARVHRKAALADDGNQAELLEVSLQWAERAARRQPSPQAWNLVAEIELLAGRPDRARDAVGRSLEIQRWNPTANQLLLYIADVSDDDDLFSTAASDVCLLRLPACPDAPADPTKP